VWDQVRGGTPTAIGAATGAVVGLVAITPACGFVMPGGALLIGAVASIVLWFLVANKHRLPPDDALDVFVCYGTAGVIGTLLTGVLASPAINPAGTGLLAGHAAQVGKQLIGVLAAAALAGAGTFVLLKLTARITPLRLTQQQEVRGVDLSEHQRTSGGGVPGGAESAGRPGVRRQRLTHPPTRPPTRLPAL